MGSGHEQEVNLVVAEGILDDAEARIHAQAAAAAGQGLLEHLRVDGRISERTFDKLLQRVLTGDLPVDKTAPTVRAWALAPTMAGGPADPASGAAIEPAPRASRPYPAVAPPVAQAWAEHTGGRSGNDSRPDVFPVPGWDRYEPIRLLGEGGMGRVFLARDLKLDRNVAIKFVRGDDPELVRRILVEARAQARVVDERICQVYDTGEIAGRVFIAMQAIEGKTLGELAGELTYEQKAMVLRSAALGVNEAHRAGLIHRDLKPSNIMVERTADGGLRTFVMDFGVARDWADDHTATGTVLGTPQYMAPEQARGEVKQLDRRADIYSLGATLYTVLVDRPPIAGDNPLVVLNRIAIDEPVRPRVIDHDVPADLDAIVMKCLEKDRAARYESARALADDLGRFLGGEPVEARRAAGLGYRLRRYLRRRWRLVAAVTVVGALVAVALGFGLRERWQAARREQLARRFTERVERIDALARTSALAPAHDLGNDRALILAQMDAIAQAMRVEGAAAQAAGHYALGRGLLALGDDDRAEQELQVAWQRGFRDPRAAYALALAKGQRYQHGLRDLALMSPAAAQAHRLELQARYRAPALDLLRARPSPDVPAAYVAALIAFYEDRFDDALAELATLDRTAGGMASFYEAPLLRGQILHARAVARRDRGEPGPAAADVAAGREALAEATAIAESDPVAHAAVADLEYTALLMELYGGGAVEGPFARGLAAVERALAILPARPASLELRAQLRSALASHRKARGEDTRDLLALIVADAESAVALAPTRREAQRALIRAHLAWGELLQSRGEDPGAHFGQVVSLAGGLSDAERDAALQVDLGIAFRIWADYEDAHGQDSTRHRQQAIEAYQRARTLEPELFTVWMNLGNNYYARASHTAGPDRQADLGQALAAFEKSRALRPGYYVPLYYLGAVHELLADDLRAQGGDPAPALARALEAYRAGLAMNPELPHLHNGISMVHVQQAEDAWNRGDDPDPFLAESLAAANQAVAAAPAQADGYNNRGEALVRRAGYERARGHDVRPLARDAVAAYSLALARVPDDPTFLLNLAGVHVLLAEQALDRGGDPRASLGEARRAVDRALTHNPRESQGHRLLGDSAALLARWSARHHLAADAGFEDAARSLRRAIELGDDDDELALALGQLGLAWAATDQPGGAGDDMIAEAIAITERLLARRPLWSAAGVVDARLRLQAARRASPAARPGQAAGAATYLAAVVSRNRNLEPTVKDDLALARRLASGGGRPAGGRVTSRR